MLKRNKLNFITKAASARFLRQSRYCQSNLNCIHQLAGQLLVQTSYSHTIETAPISPQLSCMASTIINATYWLSKLR